MVEWIQRNCRRPLSLAEVAGRFGYAPESVRDKLVRETGSPFKRHYLQAKMHRAATLLEEKPQLQVGDAAAFVGMDDPYYFSRLFRKYMGASPSQYKMSHKASGRSA
ncbi:MAG: AraC family transcriptional regulator [Spirochaetales bacterium]|nr:AraC family transcriptional regulator [Spirochaetales bacterium]